MGEYFKRPPGYVVLYVAASASLVAGAFVFSVVGLQPRGAAFLPAVFVALFGYMLNSAVQMQKGLRDKAFEIRDKFNNDENVSRAIRYVVAFYQYNGPFTARIQSAVSTIPRGKSEEFGKNISCALNFFEDVAIAVRYNEAHEAVLYELFGAHVMMAWRFIDTDYITTLRANPNLDTEAIYKNLEWLAGRWDLRHQRLYRKISTSSWTYTFPNS